MAAGGDLGVYLQALPPDLTVELAQRAEERGFGSVWFSEITFGDAFVPATAVAMCTERIRLSTGIVGLWSRSPVTTAMTAATLHALSGERFALGVGLQSRSYVDSWHGRTYERPLRAVREYLTIMRRLLDGETVTYEGEIFRVRGFRLELPPPARRVPIYLAAIGPRPVQLAGELADGLLGYVYSLQYFREVVLPNLEIGANRAGRSLDGFDIACGFPAIVTSDMSGIGQLKGQVIMFATALESAPAYEQSIALAGFERERRAIEERVAAGDLEGAVALVPDELADALTIGGTPEHARERIAAYRAEGMTTVVLNPSPPGVYFPLYEGHFPEDAALPEFSFPDYLEVVRTAIETMGPGA
jgi:probable F420-dependent oxidoreductase